MIGEDAAACRQMLEITYPMENGIVRSWEDMRHVWKYTFYDKMNIDPTQAKVGTFKIFMCFSILQIYKETFQFHVFKMVVVEA